MNNKVETTLSCALVVAKNSYVDYQTTQTGSRTTVTSKMELLVTIFDLHLRRCKRPRSDSHYRHFCSAELDVNESEANFN